MRRSLSSIPNSTGRVTAQSRLTPRSIRFPTQRAQRRFNSGSSRNTSSSQKESGSLSERLRKLSREYGWAALGVYLTLSALDFPICFAAVQLLGVERIGHFEHVVVESVKDKFSSVWPKAVTGSVEEHEVGEEDNNLVKTDKPNLEEASKFSPSIALHPIIIGKHPYLGQSLQWTTSLGIWTQLALAYAIHKTVFIFVRVPLTAAVTPKVVQALRRRGWDIGKRKPKSP